MKSGRPMHWQLLLVAVAAAVLSTASGHSALFDEFAGEDGQLSVGELGRLLEAFVFEEHLAEVGWACAPAALLSHGDVLNGDSNGFVDEGREFDAVAAMLLPCIQTFSVTGSTPAQVTLTTEAGVESFTCTAEEEGHEDHAGEEEGAHSEEISITSGSVTWGCVAAEAETEEVAGALTTSEAWGYSMLAVGIGSVGAAVVVVMFLPLCPSVYKCVDDMGALAIGALMGGTFLHMLPEAVEMHTEGFSWKLSSTFLGGFAFALTVEAVVRRLHAAATAGASTPQSGVHLGQTTCSHYAHGHSGTSHGVQAHGVLVSVRAVDGDVEMDKVAAIPGASAEDSGRQPSQSPYDMPSTSDHVSKPLQPHQAPFSFKTAHPLVWVILIGDAFHNVVDGIAIAAAFLGCSASVGWSVLGSVVLHEVPQEIGDYLVLVKLGVPRWTAVWFNVLSAVASFLGAICVLAVKSSDDNTNAYLIAFSSGTLVFIAASDILPNILESSGAKPLATARQGLLMILGCVVLGLTLLYDKHCEASGHSHAH